MLNVISITQNNKVEFNNKLHFSFPGGICFKFFLDWTAISVIILPNDFELSLNQLINQFHSEKYTY